MTKPMTKAQELEQMASEALRGSEDAFNNLVWKMAQYAINGPVARPDLNDYPALMEFVGALVLTVDGA